jgi:hypothetical protein
MLAAAPKLAGKVGSWKGVSSHAPPRKLRSLGHGSKALETMATSEPSKFCQMIAGLLPKEMFIQDASLNIREIRHVIVEAVKADDKAIEHDETPAIEHLGGADMTRNGRS